MPAPLAKVTSVPVLELSVKGGLAPVKVRFAGGIADHVVAILPTLEAIHRSLRYLICSNHRVNELGKNTKKTRTRQSLNIENKCSALLKLFTTRSL